VLLVFVVAATGAVVTAALWKSPAPVAEVAEAAEPELPPLPAAPARHTGKTSKKKTHAVARRAPAPPPVEPAAAPVSAVAAAVPPVAAAAPAPVTDPEVATEPAPVPEPFTAPPLLNTEPAAVAQAPAPEPEPEPAAVETTEPPLAFDGNGEEIARAIAKAKRREVQRCFEHELKRAPNLHGTVNVELELAPPQQVTAVRVSDDLERPELTACVTAAMQRLSFTGLNEEVSVRVPYVLTARGK